MSTDYVDQAIELRNQAEALDNGPAKMELLEETVRLSDAHRDDELGFWLRKSLVQAATFGGYPEKALVAFSWRLAHSDKKSSRYPLKDLLWEYKWIADSLGSFPQISRKQIDDMLQDMEKRFRKCDASLRPLHKLRCILAMDMCEKDEARKHHAEWQKTPRAWPSDCIACDQNHMVRFQVRYGEDDKAIELAGPILQGTMSCAEIPHATLAVVLLPLFRLGRTTEAVPLHLRGYRMISSNRKFLPEIADHLIFLTLTDNLARAVPLLEKHLPWALEATDLKARFEYYGAVRFLLEQLATTGRDKLPLRLPRSFPGYQENGEYATSELRAWFDREATELAALFDARNGNDGYTQALGMVGKLKELVGPFPIQAEPKAEEDE